MSDRTERVIPLISSLLQEDPELRDIVVEFVDGLTTRVSELRAAFETQQWDRLKTLAHQLKGAGGSYGYPAMSELGATMEQAFKQKQADAFDGCIARFNELIEAARSGLR